MSLNTAHIQGGGVLIHSGECILLYSSNVTIEFNHNDTLPGGTKSGTLYLTTHRMIFINKNQQDKLQSFSFPFVTIRDSFYSKNHFFTFPSRRTALNDFIVKSSMPKKLFRPFLSYKVEIEQPVFGANYIKGKVLAQPNGNWQGEAKFKLLFKKGGAIEYGQAMLKTINMVTNSGAVPQNPPPYSPPSGSWYQAPPPAYSPPQAGYYGWVPPTHAFPDAPPAGAVYMTDMPPPYPGINGYSGYNATYPSATAPPMGFNVPQQNHNAPGRTSEPSQSAYFDPHNPQCAYVPPPAYYEPPPSYQMNGGKKQQ